MASIEKLFEAVANNPRDVRFRDIIRVVEALGFELKSVRGSHHTYRHPKVPSKINLQPVGKSAKTYQVRQVLAIVEEYNLALRKDNR